MSYREMELPHRYAFNKHHRGGSSAREEMVEIVLDVRAGMEAGTRVQAGWCGRCFSLTQNCFPSFWYHIGYLN